MLKLVFPHNGFLPQQSFGLSEADLSLSYQLTGLLNAVQATPVLAVFFALPFGLLASGTPLVVRSPPAVRSVRAPRHEMSPSKRVFSIYAAIACRYM